VAERYYTLPAVPCLQYLCGVSAVAEAMATVCNTDAGADWR
jgi:hypothetical protein